MYRSKLSIARSHNQLLLEVRTSEAAAVPELRSSKAQQSGRAESPLTAGSMPNGVQKHARKSTHPQPLRAKLKGDPTSAKPASGSRPASAPRERVRKTQPVDLSCAGCSSDRRTRFRASPQTIWLNSTRGPAGSRMVAADGKQQPHRL